MRSQSLVKRAVCAALIPCAATAFAALLTGPLATPAHAETCSRAQFEAVVDEAGSALRQINGQNKPAFQARLRTLREKQQWSEAEFRANAVPFVQDAEITAFDDRIRNRLIEITTLGSDDETSGPPDCALLEKLRSALDDLVATLEAKWAHMFAKLDRALAGQ